MPQYTYAPEVGDPVSRLRVEAGDRTTDPLRAEWSDEDMLLILRETAETDFLVIHAAGDGVTQASVEILAKPTAYVMVLRHTIDPAPQVTVNINLSSTYGTTVDKMVDLIDYIGGLAGGWVVGFGAKAEGDVVADINHPTYGSSELLDPARLGRRTWDLAPTNGEVSCLASTEELSLSAYDVAAAAARLRSIRRENGQDVKAYTEGKVTVQYRDQPAGKGSLPALPGAFYGRIL